MFQLPRKRAVELKLLNGRREPDGCLDGRDFGGVRTRYNNSQHHLHPIRDISTLKHSSTIFQTKSPKVPITNARISRVLKNGRPELPLYVQCSLLPRPYLTGSLPQESKTVPPVLVLADLFRSSTLVAPVSPVHSLANPDAPLETWATLAATCATCGPRQRRWG